MFSIDLVVTGISYDRSAKSVTVTVKNKGTEIIDTWFFVDLYVDRKAADDLTDLGNYYGYSLLKEFAAGDSTNVVVSDVLLDSSGHNLYAQIEIFDSQDSISTHW